MKVITLEQDSLEWHEFRRTRIGASEAGTIMGHNRFKSPLELWGEKLGFIPEKPPNEKMLRGKELEPKAREIFNRQTGMDFKPMVGVSDKFEWMMASFDGLIIDEAALEIKANGPKSHTIALSGQVPYYHIAQLQHQLYVADLGLIFYFSFDGEKGIILEVERDEDFIAELLEKEKYFYHCLQTLTPPEDYGFKTMAL